MIPNDEYRKLLRAVRITASLLLLNSGWTAFTAARRVPLWAEIWENMSSGGISSLSGSLGFLVEWEAALVPAVLILILAGLIVIWSLGHLPGVVMAAGLGVALLSSLARWIDAANFSGLGRIVSKFLAD